LNAWNTEIKSHGLCSNLNKTTAVTRLWENYGLLTDENYEGGSEIGEHICIYRGINDKYVGHRRPVQKVSNLGSEKQSFVSGWLQYLIPFKVGP
jgi:hypothetical protein